MGTSPTAKGAKGKEQSVLWSNVTLLTLIMKIRVQLEDIIMIGKYIHTTIWYDIMIFSSCTLHHWWKNEGWFEECHYSPLAIPIPDFWNDEIRPSVCLCIFLSIFHVDLPLEIDPNDKNSDHFQKKKLTDGILQKNWLTEFYKKIDWRNFTKKIDWRNFTKKIDWRNFTKKIDWQIFTKKIDWRNFTKKIFFCHFFSRMLATSKNWHSSKTFVKFHRSKFFFTFSLQRPKLTFFQSFCQIPPVEFFFTFSYLLFLVPILTS